MDNPGRIPPETSGQPSKSDQASPDGREKYWAELGLEEKVERTRLAVKQVVNANNHLAQKAAELEAKLNLHSHNSVTGQPEIVQHVSQPVPVPEFFGRQNDLYF